MSARILMLPAADLAEHPAIKHLPRLNDADFAVLCQSIRENGVLQPLIVDELEDAPQVMDGRDRLRAARAVGLTEVPCLRRNADQVLTIALNSLCRKHYSASARAYLALPLLDGAVSEASSRRLQGLVPGNKKGAKFPSVGSADAREKVTPVEALAHKIGVHRDTLFQARKVAKLFGAQDSVIAGWLERTPEAASVWAEWDQEQPAAWSAFAVHWRKKAGLIEDDGDLLPPENFRERWEPELFEGQIGLGGIIQAIAGLVSTKGKTRGDKEDGEDAAYLAALRRIQRFNAEAFARWSDLPPDRRVPLIQKLTGEVPQWPEDVRRALHTSLKAFFGK